MPSRSSSGTRLAPTRLVLVRHAVTNHTGAVLSGRTPGIDLSEEGRAQAKAVAERLAALPVGAVYSSPTDRCWQTAEVVAEPHGLAVTALPGVDEVDYGEWTGRRQAEAAKTALWRVVQAAPSRARFPGGESIRAAQARAVEALDGVVASHPGELVVAVSHADVIKAAVAFYVGLPLDLFQRLAVSPASVSALAFPSSGPPTLLTLNDTGSLGDLLLSRSVPRGARRGRRERRSRR